MEYFERHTALKGWMRLVKVLFFSSVSVNFVAIRPLVHEPSQPCRNELLA
jgi:hypothetical protein